MQHVLAANRHFYNPCALSLVVGREKTQIPPCWVILPICITLFGLILLISSFFIGRWEGTALSISSVSIILASMICLIIVTGIQFFQKDDPS
ncbi:YesK family protein [Bacillus sp. A015]